MAENIARMESSTKMIISIKKVHIYCFIKKYSIYCKLQNQVWLFTLINSTGLYYIAIWNRIDWQECQNLQVLIFGIFITIIFLWFPLKSIKEGSLHDILIFTVFFLTASQQSPGVSNLVILRNSSFYPSYLIGPICKSCLESTTIHSFIYLSIQPSIHAPFAHPFIHASIIHFLLTCISRCWKWNKTTC